MSSTVAKALALLEYFSEDEPEIGLSDLARRAKIDKATVHRMMGSMADAGLVEQRSDSRLYRLGAGVLRLARVRETCFPVSSVFQAGLDTLSEKTGETAHASLISGKALATIGISESTRSSRVSLVSGEILPLHCTASGLSTLAFGPDELVKRTLSEQLEARTEHTVTEADALMPLVEQARKQGFGTADQTNEDDVFGIAVPVFDRDGFACGALAVATPTHRMTDELKRTIILALMEETKNVSNGTGGRVPAEYSALTRKFLASG
jgi:DNA-binding IclR family transcriptional regulator